MKRWYATTWIAFVLWSLVGAAFNYPQFFDRSKLTKMPSQLPPGLSITLVNGSGMPATYMTYEANMPTGTIRLTSFSPLRLATNILLIAGVLAALVYAVPKSFSLRTTFLFLSLTACAIAAAAACARYPQPDPSPPVVAPQNGVASAPAPRTTSPVDFVPAIILGVYFAPIPIAIFLRLRCTLKSNRGSTQMETCDVTHEK